MMELLDRCCVEAHSGGTAARGEWRVEGEMKNITAQTSWWEIKSGSKNKGSSDFAVGDLQYTHRHITREERLCVTRSSSRSCWHCPGRGRSRASRWRMRASTSD